MRSRWKRIISKPIGLLAILLALAATPADAQKTLPLDEMSFAELINSVDPGKQADMVRTFQEREASNVLLKNRTLSESNGCTVDAVRNREVLVVTIPAGRLFGSNQTELREDAGKYLEPFKRYLKNPDMYRVLLVMHTDNTGSETYREEITVDRAEAVTEWFEKSGADVSYLFPFAMSDDIPLVPNDSFENRDRNRRLEIYLVPGEKMMEEAKKGRIAF